MAFWINAYNALAIKAVIDGVTPVTARGRRKFFRRIEHRVAGKKISLRDIEHDILGELNEPRVHFALASASYSGPKLRSEAYRVEKLEQQLEDNARDFINDNRKNRYSTFKAKISEIFDWFKSDFGGEDAAVLTYLARYVAKQQHAEALRAGRLEIDYMDYEWIINGRPM